VKETAPSGAVSVWNLASWIYGLPIGAEWAILRPFLPAAAVCGRKWSWPMREIVNAICYVLRGGIA
jgi:hypothetical protein